MEPELTTLNQIVSFGLLVTIWIVQLVIYPAFRSIDPRTFVRWHKGYTADITWVVAPLILGQAAIGVRLLVSASGAEWLAWLNALLIAAGLILTFAVSVPCHNRLQAGQDGPTIERLIRTNWARTAVWTLAFVCSLFL